MSVSGNKNTYDDKILTYKYVISHKGVIPELYGLKKIHKTDIALKPVVLLSSYTLILL